MVAFEPFDDPEKNVNVEPTQALDAAVRDYRDAEKDTKDALRKELNNINQSYINVSEMKRGKTMDEFIDMVEATTSDSGMTNSITGKQRQFNSDSNRDKEKLYRLLKRIKASSDRGIKDIGKYNKNLKNVIKKNEITGINTDVEDVYGDRDPNTVMGNISKSYSDNLYMQREKMKEVMNKINTYDGEVSDSKLEETSYRLQTVVFGIVFVVIVGMILRSMASSQSNVIETIILFLAVALALYYLIDYFF